VASRGSLHGGSFGRVQGVIFWALDNWHAFDAWCLMKMNGTDPLVLPAYRLYNLLVCKLEDGLPDEHLAILHEGFERADAVKHPLFQVGIQKGVNPYTGKKTAEYVPPPEKQLSTEEQMAERRRQYVGDNPLRKAYRVPDWWKGEEANAQAAKQVMGGVQSIPR